MNEMFSCKTFRQAIGIAEAIARTDRDAAQAYLDKYHKRNNVEFAALCGLTASYQNTKADSWVVAELERSGRNRNRTIVHQ